MKPLIKFRTFFYSISLIIWNLRNTPLWLNSFLKGKSQYDILEKQKSYSTPVLSGVTQGRVLISTIY